jgi:hypothetical protein
MILQLVLDTGKTPLEMMTEAACWHNKFAEEAQQHYEASGHTDHKAGMTMKAHMNQCSEHASKATPCLHPKLAQIDAKMRHQGGLTVNIVRNFEESR